MTKLFKYTLYICTEDKDTRKKELNHDEIVAVLDTVFDCYTVNIGEGRYTYVDDSKCKEETYIITLIDLKMTDESMMNVCKFIKNMLNQESILLTKELINMRFV